MAQADTEDLLNMLMDEDEETERQIVLKKLLGEELSPEEQQILSEMIWHNLVLFST